MSKQLARTILGIFKRKGQSATLKWADDDDSQGKGEDAEVATDEKVKGMVLTRTNRITGESTTYGLLPMTKRSVIGAKLVTATRTYTITDVTEYRPGDVLVAQEVSLA